MALAAMSQELQEQGHLQLHGTHENAIGNEEQSHLRPHGHLDKALGDAIESHLKTAWYS
jgi:hypothetical protein